MAIGTAGRKSTTAAPSSQDRTAIGEAWRHHPAVMLARRTVNHALKRLADREGAIRAQEETVQARVAYDRVHRDQTPVNEERRKRQSEVDVDAARAELDRLKGLAVEAQEDANRARRQLADATSTAQNATLPIDALDWRINPALVAARRKLDAAAAHLAEVLSLPERAAADLATAEKRARAAEGALLAGRGTPAEHTAALEAAENARKHLVRSEAILAFARQDLATAEQDMLAAEVQAKADAALVLNVAYGAAVDQLHAALDAAATANATLAELYRLAASQFPAAQSSDPNGHPIAAGLAGELIWPELIEGAGHQPTRLFAWRRQAAAAGYQPTRP